MMIYDKSQEKQFNDVQRMNKKRILFLLHRNCIVKPRVSEVGHFPNAPTTSLFEQ